MKRISYISAFLVLALCACDKVDNAVIDNTQAPAVYHLDLQAGFGPRTKGVSFGDEGSSISTFFEETDCIYVYNETKAAYARNSTGSLTALHPSNISAARNSCTLTGDLSFYKWVGSDLVNVGIEETDTYTLRYRMNLPSSGSSMIPSYDYSSQDGGKASVSNFDFAEATGITMTLSGSTLTVPDGVLLKNLQSMFRQRLSFEKNDAPVTPGPIKILKVSTENSTLVAMYSPTDDRPYAHGSFAIADPDLTTDTDVFLSLAFDYSANFPVAGDKFILSVTDEQGNVYQGSKPVPANGFEAGKYYYGAMTLAWQGQDAKPTVTREDGGVNIGPGSDGEYVYNASSEPYPTKVAISGISSGYNFYFGNQAVVTLSGSAVNVPDNEDGNFLYDEYGFDIVLAGDFSIDSRGYETAIRGDWGYVALATNTGAAQTLTVIASNPDYRGIYGDTNYYDDSCDPANLAANGFTVTLTSTTDGPDEDFDGDPDYYTWVYTVSPQ